MFGFIVDIFNLLLYYPLFNSLILIYNYLPGHDFGLAIILLTIIIRFILYPVAIKALRSQKALQDLQPKLQELQKKHPNDKERQAKETMELYRTEKINPFSGLFLALVQIPILIALYQVFWHGLRPGALDHLYTFVANPGQINAMFIGLLDLAKPNIPLALVAGILQFFQTKMLLPVADKSKPKEGAMALMMQKQMVYFFPFVTVIILWRLPSALGLYWIISGAFSVAQQYFIFKKMKAEKVNMPTIK